MLPDANPASPKFLRLLVNGESAAPGTVGLKSGSPVGPSTWDTHFIAGTTTTFRVDATDTWGNQISTNPTVHLVTDDPNAKPSTTLNVTLTQGTTQFVWNWVTKRTSDFSGTLPPFTAASATASGYTPAFEHLVVDPDRSKTNLQILVQGETAEPGRRLLAFNRRRKNRHAADLPSRRGRSRSPCRPWTIIGTMVESPTVGQPQIYVVSNDTHAANPLGERQLHRPTASS